MAISRAPGVGTSVHGTGVVEGAVGAHRVGRRASGGDVPEAAAVPTLRVPIRGVGALDPS